MPAILDWKKDNNESKRQTRQYPKRSCLWRGRPGNKLHRRRGEEHQTTPNQNIKLRSAHQRGTLWYPNTNNETHTPFLRTFFESEPKTHYPIIPARNQTLQNRWKTAKAKHKQSRKVLPPPFLTALPGSLYKWMPSTRAWMVSGADTGGNACGFAGGRTGGEGIRGRREGEQRRWVVEKNNDRAPPLRLPQRWTVDCDERNGKREVLQCNSASKQNTKHTKCT